MKLRCSRGVVVPALWAAVIIAWATPLMVVGRIVRLAGQTRLDPSQVRLEPAEQRTYVNSGFDPARRVNPPATAGQSCAEGSWALTESHLYLCELREAAGFRWARLALERF